MERLPILIDSLKKLDHQLSSDPDKTPLSNAANTDSEPEDMNQPGESKQIQYCVYFQDDQNFNAFILYK